MKIFTITLEKTHQYVTTAHTFDILDDVLYLYDEECTVKHVIKKWDFFKIENIEDEGEDGEEKKIPDDIYDALETSN